MATTLSVTRYRELEESLHTNLHKHLCLLTLYYAPSKDFSDLLKEGMFAKSNPPALLHVMHYLLTIIDPDGFKSSFIWPLYDKSMEATFRATLRTYLSQLNDRFPFAQIPPVKVSYMVTPAGLHFTRLVIKLCELAMIMHLQKLNKSILLPSDFKVAEQNTIPNLIDQVDVRLKTKITLRDELYEEADKEADLLKSRLQQIESKTKTHKSEWKDVVLSMPEIPDAIRQSLIEEPNKVIETLKEQIPQQIICVENFNKALFNTSSFYNEINDMASVLMTRRGKNHCLSYENEIKDVLPLRKYVAEKDIHLVEHIVEDGVLNFPLLLHCFKSVLSQLPSNILVDKNNTQMISGLNHNVTILEECLFMLKDLDSQISEMDDKFQESINEARRKFERKLADNDDSPISLTSSWPAPSPYRNLQWFNNRLQQEIPANNHSVTRTISMVDISAFSKTLSLKKVQPTGFSAYIMSNQKSSRKPVLQKTNEKYKSTPCLSSAKCRKDLATLMASNSTRECRENDRENTDPKINSTPTQLTQKCNEDSLIKQSPKLVKISQLDDFITPQKEKIGSSMRKSDVLAIERRLSRLADEMPLPHLISHNNISNLCDNSILSSPLGYSSPEVPVAKLISLNNTKVDDANLDSSREDKPDNFNKKLSTEQLREFASSSRFSLGPLAKDFCGSLQNVSGPIEFNLSIDSD